MNDLLMCAGVWFKTRILELFANNHHDKNRPCDQKNTWPEILIKYAS
jgi:hypothetical protein